MRCRRHTPAGPDESVDLASIGRRFRMIKRVFRFLAWTGAACVILAAPGETRPASAGEVPKLLYLLVEDDRLIASNIHLSRFDELRLGAEEPIVEKSVADAVAVVVTRKRFIAYSAFTGAWRPLRLWPEEKLITLEAQDFSVLIMTSERILNFNGRSGIWAQTER
jgi:hypothetical protein